MPLFLIERSFAETVEIEENPEITRVHEELGARWLYSYLSADKKRTYCLYEAPNAEVLYEAARKLGVPADRVVEVAPRDGPQVWAQSAGV